MYTWKPDSSTQPSDKGGAAGKQPENDEPAQLTATRPYERTYMPTPTAYNYREVVRDPTSTFWDPVTRSFARSKDPNRLGNTGAQDSATSSWHPDSSQSSSADASGDYPGSSIAPRDDTQATPTAELGDPMEVDPASPRYSPWPEGSDSGILAGFSRPSTFWVPQRRDFSDTSKSVRERMMKEAEEIAGRSFYDPSLPRSRQLPTSHPHGYLPPGSSLFPIPESSSISEGRYADSELTTEPSTQTHTKNQKKRAAAAEPSQSVSSRRRRYTKAGLNRHGSSPLREVRHVDDPDSPCEENVSPLSTSSSAESL
jgi:hypothetical protein